MTSNALTRILLEKKFGATPRYTSFDPGKRPIPRGVDAAVVIGDNSFRRLGVPSLDLGEEWKRFTGLPFVFAVWMHRRNHPRRAHIRTLLQNAKKKGMRLRREIARREAKRMRIDPRRAERYLTERIRYDLGPRERAGMRRFRKYCTELELV